MGIDEKYEVWEKEMNKLKRINAKILLEFEDYLKSKSLKSTTIKKHIFDIEVYAKAFLLNNELIPIEEGVLYIDDYLGDYFVRKVVWSSKAVIRRNIVSFKKFYTFLNEKGLVSNENLQEMKEVIKCEQKDWLDN